VLASSSRPAAAAAIIAARGPAQQRGKLPQFREFSLSRIPASGQPRNRSAAAGIADLTEIHYSCTSISSSQNTRKKAEARKKAEELNSQQPEHVTPIEPF
jgi:hypothetical protein